MNLAGMTISKVREGLDQKEFSASDLAREYLDFIKEKDKEICSFISFGDDLVFEQAKKIDKLIAKKENIPVLAGVPCAVKDNILVEGVQCTAASKMLEKYIAPYDATAVEKLKAGGSVILGKTNLDEFAMGSSTENSAFFTTHNPHDLNRVPGGSSGGSAAAVAADLCVFSLGSDTGGSIRHPASFCGVVGLKPTYGAVSRYGLIAFASSLDQIGPIAKTVDDAKIVFDAIRGKDAMDSTSRAQEQTGAQTKMNELRIGVPKEYFIGGMDANVGNIIKSVIKRCEEAGAKIEEVSLPHTEYALSCYYIIATAEASANLARYDGIRYGQVKNAEKIKDLLEYYLTAKEQGFGAEVRRRIMLGTYVLSSGYYDAYYLRAQKVRTLIKQDFERAFQSVDAIFTSVAPTPAFKIGEKISDPLKMYLSDIFTISVNLAGLPALSVPAGLADNLPVGMQIIGKPFEEEKIMDIGKFIEEAN